MSKSEERKRDAEMIRRFIKLAYYRGYQRGRANTLEELDKPPEEAPEGEPYSPRITAVPKRRRKP